MKASTRSGNACPRRAGALEPAKQRCAQPLPALCCVEGPQGKGEQGMGPNEDVAVVAQTGPIFQSDLPLREKLERARTELLDLSARNRLLSMPRGARGARSIEVVDEKA